MIFDFSDRDKVKINMTEYLSKVIADFPEEIVGETATPAGNHLFKVQAKRGFARSMMVFTNFYWYITNFGGN
jgi:hypothetical protein